MEIENPMVNDACWPDYESDEDERENAWEKLCRKADEAYDGRFDEWQS